MCWPMSRGAMSELVSAPATKEDTPAKSGGILRDFFRMLRRGRNGDGSIRDTLEELKMLAPLLSQARQMPER